MRRSPPALPTPDDAAKVEDRFPLDLAVPYHEGTHRFGIRPEPSPERSPPRAAPDPPRALTLAAGMTVAPSFS
jgi:hypothetical protein